MIVLVRHGQTAVNRSGLLQGRVDVGLTETGVAQARRLAAVLAVESPTQVVTSPLRRARDTAEVIAVAAGLEVVVDERLVEIDYGEWDRRPVADVTAEEWARWRADPSWAPPGGESLASVYERVVDFCVERVEEPGPLVAVSHVSPIKAAVTWALGVGEDVTWRTRLALASITRIGWRDGLSCLESFNETGHLRPAPEAVGEGR